MAEQRLPAVNGDDGQWGDILNQFIEKEHYNTGLDNPINGSHQNITIRPGTTSAGTAPLKFTSGPLISTPEIGAVEFLSDKLYITQTTDITRKVLAMYDETLGAAGDLYYRDSSANFVRLAAGTGADILRITSGLPAWGAVPATGNNYEIQFNNSAVMGSSSNFTYDSTNLRVVVGENAVVIPDNPLALVGDVDAYLQVNLQNKSIDSNASADYIITADNGDDTQNYADFGINNSNYANPTWDMAGPDDTYLLADGGDIAIASLTPNKKVNFFIANTIHEAHPADLAATVDSDGINLPAGKTFRVGGIELDQSGEANTASNIGTSGVGVFDNKNLIDLRFKNIVADSTKISITDHPTEHTIGIDLGAVALADLSDDSTHRLVSDAQLTVLGNTSNTNSGDQVADGTTITGAGTVADPFVAVTYDQDLNTTDSPSFVDASLDGLGTGQLVISNDSVKTSIQALDANAQCYSGGVVVNPSFTDNADGSVTFGSGTYNLFSQADGTGVIKRYVVDGNTFTLTDQTENYIYVEYNNGAPRLSNTTNRNILTHTTTQTLYSIYRDGTTIITLDWDGAGNALSNRLNRRNIYTNRFGIQTAPMLGEVATRTITVGSGIIWIGVTNQSLDTFSSATDALYFLRHVSGVWTKSTVTQYNNTQYDDGANPQTVTDGNYAVSFYYREVTSQKRVYMVLGNGDYNLAEAQAATPPAGLPSYIGTHTVLIGRLIVQKNSNTATQINSSFTTVFASTPVAEHNQLSDRDIVGNHQRLIPIIDNDTAIQITKVNGTPVLNIDTLNNAIYVSGVGIPSAAAGAKFNSWDTIDGFTQSNIQNLSDGASASADHTATNDIGDDDNHYIDMGINGSNYSDIAWTINGANDGYLYVAGGNLAVGTDASYTDVFTDGFLAANRRARFSSTGLDVTGNITATNLSGSNTGDQTKIANIIGGNNTTLLGSMPYQSNTDTTILLTPNVTTTKKFLRQTGTGANGAAPVWDTIAVGDVPTMTATVGGLVPTPPNNTTTFLRGDGTFAAPTGGSGLTQQQVMAISSMRM